MAGNTQQGTPCKLVGRIVWGHPTKAQIKKNQETKQPIIRDGKQVEQWVFGIAVPKADVQTTVWPAMAQEIAKGYPQGIPPRFSYKYKDGDGVDDKGQPFNKREGYAGCWVITVSSEAFAPSVFRWDGRQYVQMKPEEIKCGDFISADVNFKVNVPTNNTHTPGLYVNPNGILHIGYGQEIVSAGGADPTELFGAAPQYTLPPGASAQPMAPNTGNAAMPSGPPQMPGAPPAGPQYGAPPAGPQYGAPPAAPGGYPQHTPPTSGPQPGYPPQMPGGPPQGYAPQPGYPPAGAPPAAPGSYPMPGQMPPR